MKSKTAKYGADSQCPKHGADHPLHDVMSMQNACMPYGIDLMMHLSKLLNLGYHKYTPQTSGRPLIISINRARYGQPTMAVLEWQGSPAWCRIVVNLDSCQPKLFLVDGKSVLGKSKAEEAFEVIVKYLHRVNLLESRDWTKGDELTYMVGCFRNGMYSREQLCDFIMGKKSVDQLEEELHLELDRVCERAMSGE